MPRFAIQVGIGSFFAGVALTAAVGPAPAQEAVEQFYRGKTFTILIGSAVGGGYDSYARLVGRHIGKYIPGNPNVIFTNMPGAGGATVVNYLNSVAPRDGSTMVATTAPSLLEPLIGVSGAVRFDPRKFNYIGSANKEVSVCLLRKDAPVKKFEDIFATEAIIGSSGGTTHDMPAALVATLGARIKLISGYAGTRELMLATEKGEVQGLCGIGYTSIISQRSDWGVGPDSPVRVLVQETLESEPLLNKAGVPRAIDFARTTEQRQVLEIVYSHLAFTRPFLMSSEVPRERVEAIRKAFLQALADPEAPAEAEKQSLVLGPMSGADLSERILGLYAMPKEIIERTKTALATF